MSRPPRLTGPQQVGLVILLFTFVAYLFIRVRG